MQNTNTELSNRTAAAFSWMEFLGLVVVILSQTVVRQQWLFYVGALVIVASYVYKMVRDWRAGNHKGVRMRLAVLVVAVVAGLIVGYLKMK
jgi:hypothetical protein